ncbi:Gfo/Idh/MocA family oxidoreductase [Rubellicoccus peritrichatus]|uniref:Gfo/Idh/MocA family oxidoreductase n=1 Tax=Rubellicoccus peritrichatus TaxID=3080537 RepID=A0AAQ3QY53_9BACT|nr:Gfo/Idh/MocA family oxidoreductase [Puniceicoccus sp. CR14]WOO43727.1 Gfo/Idh/MocA family oxidoreductase [Puniceicoccus sp. CR14]
MKTEFNRRKFIKTSLSAGALVGFPTIIPSSALGKDGAVAPSNRVNVGVLSCGARSAAAGAYNHYGKSQLVAVCDPVLERRLEKAEAWGVSDHYNDFRDVLARSDVDAVHISTSDHWHVPMSLAAARAGKDIYCEKPLGLTIEENLASRAIVDEYDRVFQYGTQQRSQASCRMGIELVLNGHIGDVQEVYVWAPQGASGGSATPVLPVPEGFDYDLWLGPAPEAPFCYDRCLNRGAKAIWFDYDYAIGFVAGWGAHPMDQLQWWADNTGMGIPYEYKATGTIPTKGLFNTLVHWDLEAVYKDGTPLRFMDSKTAAQWLEKNPIPGLKYQGNCTVFKGTKGWVAVSRGLLQASSEELRRKAKDPGPIRLEESRNHQHNFIDHILARTQPVSPLDSAIESDIICHMTDLCARTNETLQWDPKEETVVGSADAVSRMSRPMRAPWTL